MPELSLETVSVQEQPPWQRQFRPPLCLNMAKTHAKTATIKTARKDCNDESRLVQWIGLDLQGVGANGGYRQTSSTIHGTAYSDKLELVQRWAQEALQLTPLPTTKSAPSTSGLGGAGIAGAGARAAGAGAAGAAAVTEKRGKEGEGGVPPHPAPAKQRQQLAGTLAAYLCSQRAQRRDHTQSAPSTHRSATSLPEDAGMTRLPATARRVPQCNGPGQQRSSGAKLMRDHVTQRHLCGVGRTGEDEEMKLVTIMQRLYNTSSVRVPAPHSHRTGV